MSWGINNLFVLVFSKDLRKTITELFAVYFRIVGKILDDIWKKVDLKNKF